MNQPKISMVIIIYSCGYLLRETIDDTLIQTQLSLEIVALDNGSTD